MRFSIAKNSFVDAVSTVSAVCSSGGLDAFNAVQIEAHEIDQLVHIRAVSGEMSMATKVKALVESDGITMVPARVLASIARAADGAELDCELVGADLKFNGRGGGVSCRTLAENNFPYPKMAAPPVIATVSTDAFKAGVSRATLVAIKNDPTLWSGIRLWSKDGEVTLVGCDSTHVVRTVIGHSDVDFRGVMTQKSAVIAAKLAGRDSEMAISGDENRVGFRVGSYSMRAVQMNGDYAEVERVMPATPDTVVKVDYVSLLSAINRVKAVAKTGVSDGVQMSLTAGEGRVTIDCAGELGSVHEELAAEVEGPWVVGVKFKWNYVVDVVGFMEPGDAVLGFCTERNNALLVRQGDWSYMAMPIGIKK